MCHLILRMQRLFKTEEKYIHFHPFCGHLFTSIYSISRTGLKFDNIQLSHCCKFNTALDGACTLNWSYFLTTGREHCFKSKDVQIVSLLKICLGSIACMGNFIDFWNHWQIQCSQKITKQLKLKRCKSVTIIKIQSITMIASTRNTQMQFYDRWKLLMDTSVVTGSTEVPSEKLESNLEGLFSGYHF